jgi:hypothetical protein
MTPKQLAHEFFLGIREAMACPDVSVAEYEGVIAYKIEAMLKAEREACAKILDDLQCWIAPHIIAAAIRARTTNE